MTREVKAVAGPRAIAAIGRGAPPASAPCVSRFVYWGCFYVSYRLVFTTMFIAGFAPYGAECTAGLANGAQDANDAVRRSRVDHRVEAQA
ncbi:MAG TPA: hypothetical protein VND64_13275 [Pirellulales bacterium]|nr:hypothetical protein [Pirellulales bacterium]